MIAALASISALTVLATPRRAVGVLVLLHAPMIGFLIAVSATGLAVYPDNPNAAADAAFATVIGALQLTLSLRVARRRTGGPVNVLCYAGILAFAIPPAIWDPDGHWLPVVWFVAASGAMVAPPRLRPVAFGVPVVASLLDFTRYVDTLDAATAYVFTYELVIFVLGASALVVSTRAVQVVVDLSASRAELGELVSRTERQRAGRDLHDTLGQRLSAVSIKGDLALALLPGDSVAAARELAEVATIARAAVTDLDSVAHDAERPRLDEELRRCVDLLRAAGVRTESRVVLPPLAEPVENVLAWAVREAGTNLLCHSNASSCRIVAGAQLGAAVLEVVNDGAGRPSGRLGGLAGLAERARRHGGTVEAGRVGLDGFRLRVTVPLATAVATASTTSTAGEAA